MRAPLLALLVVALATAPSAMVPTGTAPARAKAAQETGSRADATGAPKAPASQHPGRDDNQRRIPARTSWSELNPGHQPVPGPSPDAADNDELRPELPPALYARRLAAAPLPAAPPHDPPRADLRAGHLALPPPVA